MQLIYTEYVRCCKLSCKILKDNKNGQKGVIRLVITYMCAMFHQDSFKTKGLVCVASDGHLNMRTHGHKDRRTGLVRLLYCSILKCI